MHPCHTSRNNELENVKGEKGSNPRYYLKLTWLASQVENQVHN